MCGGGRLNLLVTALAALREQLVGRYKDRLTRRVNNRLNPKSQPPQPMPSPLRSSRPCQINPTAFHLNPKSQPPQPMPSPLRSSRSCQINPTAFQHLETLADRLDDFLPTASEEGLGTTGAFVESVVKALAAN
jgi:hypothetical protein